MRSLYANRERTKPANFGSPATAFPIEAGEMVWLLCYLIAETAERRRYRDERENPEWVDLGGEG